MKNLLYYLLNTALLFLSTNCTEPTEPEKEKEVFTVVVTGTVSELIQTGSEPLVGCNVSLIATNAASISQTDSNGAFLDTLITSDDTFRLKIEKAGFSTIDTVLQRNKVNFLNFTMSVSDAFVSGTITENTITGSQQSDSCRISIITSTGTTITYSDHNGDFSNDVPTTDITVRLLLEKDGFGTIDTTIQSSAAQNLDITIDFNRIEVSGRLYKTGLSGTFPFPDCEMKIYSGGIENTVLTNNEGYFELLTNTFDDSVRILIENVSYSEVDTTFSIVNATGLVFTLGEMVYFFPFTVGNSWTYDVYIYSGDYTYTKVIGEEKWEIIEISADTSSIKIQSTFNGVQIDDHQDNLGDTTYYVNYISEIELNILSYLSFSSCNGCINNYIPPSGRLFQFVTGGSFRLYIIHPYDIVNRIRWLNSYYKMLTTHPTSSPDYIRIRIGDKYFSEDWRLIYELDYSIGIINIDYYSDPSSITLQWIRYNLIDYNIQK